VRRSESPSTHRRPRLRSRQSGDRSQGRRLGCVPGRSRAVYLGQLTRPRAGARTRRSPPRRRSGRTPRRRACCSGGYSRGYSSSAAVGRSRHRAPRFVLVVSAVAVAHDPEPPGVGSTVLLVAPGVDQRRRRPLVPQLAILPGARLRGERGHNGLAYTLPIRSMSARGRDLGASHPLRSRGDLLDPKKLRGERLAVVRPSRRRPGLPASCCLGLSSRNASSFRTCAATGWSDERHSSALAARKRSL